MLPHQSSYRKAHRLKFGTRQRAFVPGEVINADVCGPFEESVSGYSYYVLLKRIQNECSRSGHRIQSFMSDNGGEVDNNRMKETLCKYDIEQILTMPYRSEMNGYIEKDNRTVVVSNE